MGLPLSRMLSPAGVPRLGLWASGECEATVFLRNTVQKSLRVVWDRGCGSLLALWF